MPRVPRLAPDQRRPLARAPLRRVPVPRRRRFRLLGYAVIAAVWGALALALVLLWFAHDLPRPEAALDAARRPSLALEDRAGHVFATFGDIVGDPLRLNDLPAYLPAAAVAIEDRRFWHHPGIDPIGLARAVWVNLTSGRVGAGRLHHHPAGRQEPVPDQCAHVPPQGAGTAADAVAGAHVQQARDPRDLAEPRLSRLRRLGRGRRGADVFRRLGATRDPVAGGDAGRAAARAVAVQSAHRSRRRRRPRPRGAGGDGRDRRDHRRAGAAPRRHRSRCRRRRRSPPAGSPTGWPIRRRRVAAGERRCQRAHDARCAVAGSRRSAAGRAAGWTGRRGRRHAGRGGRARRRHRRGARHGRRSRLSAELVQPRGAGAPSARLGVQAVRLAAALEKGVRPDDTVLDAPIRIGNWSPADFERQYPRRDHGRGGTGAVDQHLGRAAVDAGRRAARGGEAGGAARHRRQAAERRVAGARHRRGRAAGTGRGLCRVLQRRHG